MMTDTSKNKEIEQIIKNVKGISSLSAVFSKVNKLLDDPKSNASDFNRTISEDIGLAARLLKLVNSAMYGFPRKIETISRAITIIGFKELRNLVLATSVLNMFKNLDDVISFNVEDFWKHNLACGIASRVLAIYKRVPDPEMYFLAGLLHDIGRLVLLESRASQYRELITTAREKNSLLFEMENEIFGYTHETVGKAFVSYWKLPEYLEDAVGFHHNPRDGELANDYADIVHLANFLVSAAEIGSSGEVYIPKLSGTSWDRTGLQIGIIESAYEKIYEQFEDARSYIMD